jgi:hypothetical protein
MIEVSKDGRFPNGESLFAAEDGPTPARKGKCDGLVSFGKVAAVAVALGIGIGVPFIGPLSRYPLLKNVLRFGPLVLLIVGGVTYQAGKEIHSSIVERKERHGFEEWTSVEEEGEDTTVELVVRSEDPFADQPPPELSVDEKEFREWFRKTHSFEDLPTDESELATFRSDYRDTIVIEIED